MRTPLRQELETAFRAYIEELKKAPVLGSLGTLHVVCALPDVCAALQTTDGRTDRGPYQDWIDRHVVRGDSLLRKQDWYKMRCSVLHQGSGLPEGSEWDLISFTFAGSAPATMHRREIVKADGPQPVRNITLHIPALAEEILTGLHNWFDWLETPDAGPVRERVRSRLYTVLSPKPKRWPGINVTGEVLGSSGVVAAIVPEE